MRYRTALFLVCAVATAAQGQGVVKFQDGVTLLNDNSFYEGTIDTEFRAAAPTTPQFENPNISVDQFDSGFQTQGALRFVNVLVSEGGLLPDGLAVDDIVFAELSLWKQSPSQSDADITFHRVIGPDTTSGSIWEEEDTWASLGGDLIPDAAGLLNGDPITRDDVEAASGVDFRDSGSRFAADDLVTLNPNDGPVPSSLVYTTDRDSENVFDDAWDGSTEDLSRAIDLAAWRFNVTDTVRDWFADSDPATPGTQPAEPNYGWAINNDTGDGWDFRTSEVIDPFESEFSDLDTRQFRPALTVIFNDGPLLDLNGDDVENVADFEVFLDLLASEFDGPLATGAPGDFNFDRRVDLNDFKFFKENFPGGEAGLEAALASVPEPATGLMALWGVLGMAAMRRRQRN